MGRCVQYTRYGEICVAECGGKEKKYNWCLTNSIKIGDGVGEGYWWEYCSLVGYTIKKTECVDECARHGERYWWCHTRYNYKCIERCEKKGTSYYWCNKEGGSWDYCSPSAKLGVHKSDHVELTRYGVKCRDVCGLKGENYYWCTQHGGDYNNWWDYCSPRPTTTINQGTCKDECDKRGSSYYWCSTDTGWDYCSPEYTPGGFQGHETVTSTTLMTALIIGAVFVGAFLLCIVGIVCLKRVSGP